MQYVYTAVFSKEPNGSLRVSFPDLPGCYAQGSNMVEAVKKAEAVLCLCLFDMEQNGIPIPTSRYPDDIETKEGEVTSIILANTDTYNARFANSTVQHTVSIPSWLGQMAETSNLDMSRVFQNAIKSEIGMPVHKNYEKPAPVAPPIGDIDDEIPVEKDTHKKPLFEKSKKKENQSRVQGTLKPLSTDADDIVPARGRESSSKFAFVSLILLAVVIVAGATAFLLARTGLFDGIIPWRDDNYAVGTVANPEPPPAQPTPPPAENTNEPTDANNNENNGTEDPAYDPAVATPPIENLVPEVEAVLLQREFTAVTWQRDMDYDNQLHFIGIRDFDISTQTVAITVTPELDEAENTWVLTQDSIVEGPITTTWDIEGTWTLTTEHETHQIYAEFDIIRFSDTQKFINGSFSTIFINNGEVERVANDVSGLYTLLCEEVYDGRPRADIELEDITLRFYGNTGALRIVGIPNRAAMTRS